MSDVEVIDFTGVHTKGNSYLTVEAVTNFLVALNIDVSNLDVAQSLFKAIDFIDSFEFDFKGERLDSNQPLAFPRAIGLSCRGVPRLLNTQGLIKAVLHAVEVVAKGSDLSPVIVDKEAFVTKKKLDVLEKQYSDKYAKSAGSLSQFPMIERYLLPYMKVRKNPSVGRR